MMKKNNSLFLIRVNFILAIMIIWHHAYNVDVYNLESIGKFSSIFLLCLEKYFSIIQLVAVPLFLLMSGYLFYRNYTWDKVWTKYQSRFHSLLIPYLSWNLLVYVFYIIVTRIPLTARLINKDPIGVSLYSIYRNVICCDINSSMWFIRALIVLVALSPVFYFFLNKGKFYAWAIYVASIVIYVIFPVGQHSALFSCSFFLLGALIAIYYPDLLFLNVNPFNCSVSFSLFLILNICYVHFDVFNYPRARAIFLLIDIALFWITARGIKSLSSLNEPPWYFRISFFVFCMHGIVLESIEKIILVVIGNNIQGAYVDYILAPIITLVIICVIAKVLREHALPVWNVLSGGRD